ncbi:hypothetical protein IV417_15660 [Alphaproteobacteria bacterium KMM 3653]|uniref:Uncharacterized protein n=1 Tax=Harenicola maris TaxID=2841044 RepID=A0AAP2G4Z3_9RHOB|nr:hypothetical protein [Harenicola maris]
MQDTPDFPPEPGNLRLLRRMVTLLMAVMIIGMIVLTSLFIIRFRAPQSMAFPPQITLPEGAKAQAITQGPGWIGVVTTDSRILIFDATGALTQEVTVDLP